MFHCTAGTRSTWSIFINPAPGLSRFPSKDRFCIENSIFCFFSIYSNKKMQKFPWMIQFPSLQTRKMKADIYKMKIYRRSWYPSLKFVTSWIWQTAYSCLWAFKCAKHETRQERTGLNEIRPIDHVVDRFYAGTNNFGSAKPRNYLWSRTHVSFSVAACRYRSSPPILYSGRMKWKDKRRAEV